MNLLIICKFSSRIKCVEDETKQKKEQKASFFISILAVQTLARQVVQRF